MFAFEKEQVVYTIGEVRIGGSPGENPTVLAGSIFYEGDKIVEDAVHGVFDRKSAETLINRQDELAEITGNPAIVQVVASSSEALLKYIEFVADITDAPLIIDSTTAEVRIAGLKYSEEIGLLDNVIYNSLNISATSDELEALSEVPPESAIVLSFNPQDSSIAGRRKVLDEGGLDLERGLLAIADDLGIAKPLLDTATTAIGAGAGSSIGFIFVAKATYGLPTGSGVHNAPVSWPWLREYKKQDKAAYKTCDVSSSLLVLMMGADFVLYGPIKNADLVFPVVAMGNVFMGEFANTELGIEPSKNHPFSRLV
ncbi:MAG: tetrahydromethanopterin S-methyltransferase subunit H [Candidatus Thorarchaeota archaeon]